MIKSLDNLGNGNTSTEVEANGTNLVLTTIHFLSTVMSHCLHKHPGNTHTHTRDMKGGDGFILLLLLCWFVFGHVAILNVHLPLQNLGLHPVGTLDQLLTLSGRGKTGSCSLRYASKNVQG